MKKTVILIFILTILGLKLFAQVTGDPWIKKVYNDTWHRDPVGIEWNIKNYAGAAWKNYNELYAAVIQYQKNMADQGITFRTSASKFNNCYLVCLYQNNNLSAASVISTNGGGIVASGGGNIVASGGGNIVASGGGNIVASGGGNIVASGGGNIVPRIDTKGFTVGASYHLLSVGETMIKTSGTGAIYIK